MSKKLTVFVIILVVIILGLAGYFYCFPQYQKWQIDKQGQKFVDDYIKPYKEDTYGGATPEATWSMFLEALQKGDVELAAKYFEVDKQAEKLIWLKDIKDKGMLGDMVNDLTTFKLSKVTEYGDYVEYVMGPEGGDAIGSPIFIKNTINNIWKISSL